jgi:hypothetical protein
MRLMTRDPEFWLREWRLWERPRRRGGERDGCTFYSPEPSPICGCLERGCDAIATARIWLWYQMTQIPETRWYSLTHTHEMDTGILLLQSYNVLCGCYLYLSKVHIALHGRKLFR